MWGAPDARRMLKPLCVAQVLDKIILFVKLREHVFATLTHSLLRLTS